MMLLARRWRFQCSGYAGKRDAKRAKKSAWSRGRALLATGFFHHISQREGGEVVMHVPSYILPYRQQDTLSLVFAGSVLVRLSEITSSDRPVDSTYHLCKSDVFRWMSKDISTAYPSLGSDQAGSLQ